MEFSKAQVLVISAAFVCSHFVDTLLLRLCMVGTALVVSIFLHRRKEDFSKEVVVNLGTPATMTTSSLFKVTRSKPSIWTNTSLSDCKSLCIVEVKIVKSDSKEDGSYLISVFRNTFKNTSLKINYLPKFVQKYSLKYKPFRRTTMCTRL